MAAPSPASAAERYQRTAFQVRGKEHERKAFWAFLFFYPDDGGFCRYYVQQDINQIALTLQDAHKDVFSATRGLYLRSSFRSG